MQTRIKDEATMANTQQKGEQTAVPTSTDWDFLQIDDHLALVSEQDSPSAWWADDK
jgi:hypothetical protein